MGDGQRRVVEVKGAELLDTITREAKSLGVSNALLTLIGGVDSFTISTMPADDATADTVTSYDLPGEMTATGESVDGTVHVHAVMGVGDRAIAGHLHSADVQTHFARAYVQPC